MSSLLKFAGGLALGAAIGAGAYLLVTKEQDKGFLQDVKGIVNQAIEEGKRAAEEQRRQLEQELGFSLTDENTPIAVTPNTPEQSPSSGS